MQTDIPELVLNTPELLIGLTVVILLIVAYQQTLSYQEYRFAHLTKSIVFKLADAWATQRGRPLIRPKRQPSDSGEFVMTVDYSPKETYQKLREAGFSPHLVATTKVRNGEFTHAQLIYLHEDGQQTEVFFWPGENGVDVYAHVETAVTNPTGHLTDGQELGDTRGKVKEAL